MTKQGIIIMIIIIMLDEIQLKCYDGNPLPLYAVVDKSEYIYIT